MQRQQIPAPDRNTTDIHSMQRWQQQKMYQAQAPVDTATQLLQYRERLDSAPQLPSQRPAPSQHDFSGSIRRPASDCHNNCHW
ncbi:hypothetical protein N7533_006471 [Penicillium manginii]|uniref:uncharacterized protein n=1 Tax=Penicillium manginii TaxID=203109 RepID=UPI0025487BCF|nr:uncharacterized protein N7533_006471 [Penicillium manginii]KAJ5749443.1 hypothetical protein N7533_006471 [Penicillium manginii]